MDPVSRSQALRRIIDTYGTDISTKVSRRKPRYEP